MQPVAEQAVAAFVAMRQIEGARLRDDVLSRADTIEQAVEQIERRSPETVREHMEKMQARRSGSVVNIGSMRGLDSPHFPFYPPAMGDQPVNYTTEKWAMIGLTKYMAGRYGKHHIRVNCIAPGGFNPGLSDDPERKSFVDTYIANCPLGCWANEDDIKGPIVFLASEAANYVTGATIVMDGGWTIW